MFSLSLSLSLSLCVALSLLYCKFDLRLGNKILPQQKNFFPRSKYFFRLKIFSYFSFLFPFLIKNFCYSFILNSIYGSLLTGAVICQTFFLPRYISIQKLETPFTESSGTFLTVFGYLFFSLSLSPLLSLSAYFSI